MNNKVLVFSIALEGYEHLFRSCIQTHMDYCKLHQYEYVLVNQAPRRLCPSEAAWLKIPLMKAALEGGYEWVAFLDADCDVRSHTPRFSQYLNSLDKDKSIFMAPGLSGRLNSGVIFARRQSSSLAFLDTILMDVDDKVPPEDHAPYENGHIIHHGKNNPAIYMLEHQLWNNNSKLNRESYIQHYSGGPLRRWYRENRAPVERQSYFESLLQKVARKFSIERFSAKPQAIPASQSIDELMPYYQKKYPAFGRVLLNV